MSALMRDMAVGAWLSSISRRSYACLCKWNNGWNRNESDRS